MSWYSHAFSMGVVVSLAFGTSACDEEKKPTEAKPATTASATATATAKAPERMPEVSLHESGVNVGFDQLALTTPSFDVNLRSLLKKYPVEKPDTVIFNVARKVKTPTAVKIFYALIDAGAKQIEVRTKPRGTFPGQLIISSEKEIGDGVPGCTRVGMILDDLGATFWKKEGGLAKRYTKGMAGPDLSALNEVMHDEAKLCNSKVFLFSGQGDVDWGHTYDIATSIKAADPPYEKIDKYVLLREEPVPGKPVKAGK